MSRTRLHLVNAQGAALSEEIGGAVEAAFRWAVREFPYLDPALLAGWAEEVGRAMSTRVDSIHSPRRYAFAALHGKIREWFRRNPAREIPAGAGSDLERWVQVHTSPLERMDQAILFEQLKRKLNERDREILVLLQQDITSPANVAAALGISYAAAAKAIQRVKERIAAILKHRSTHDPS